MYPWYEDEVRYLEQRQAADPAPAGSTLLYGSSSARLWITAAQDFPVEPLVNRAFGGSTLGACVHFWDRLVLPVRPARLLFYAGDNDLGDGAGPDTVVAHFQELLRRVEALPGLERFAFLSVKPSPCRMHLIDRIQETNRRVEALLVGHALGTYIDVHHPMLRPDGAPNPAFFLEDGLHLSPAGYQLWAQVVREHRPPVLRTMAETAPAPPPI